MITAMRVPGGIGQHRTTPEEVSAVGSPSPVLPSGGPLVDGLRFTGGRACHPPVVHPTGVGRTGVKCLHFHPTRSQSSRSGDRVEPSQAGYWAVSCSMVTLTNSASRMGANPKIRVILPALGWDGLLLSSQIT